MLTRLRDKANEARALTECLDYLHPIAVEQEFLVCANHIMMARDAARALHNELVEMIGDIERGAASDSGPSDDGADEFD